MIRRSLGIYVQTCAHIELLSSALIALIEIPDPSSDEWLTRYSKLRKYRTEDLLKELKRTCAKDRAVGISEGLSKLCDWMMLNKMNRHVAVHGAFFGRPDGTTRVDYIQRHGSRKEPTYARTESAITTSIIIEALDDADDILLSLTGMLTSINEGALGQIIAKIMPHALNKTTGGWLKENLVNQTKSDKA